VTFHNTTGLLAVCVSIGISLIIAACTLGAGVPPRGDYEAAALYSWGGEYVVRWPVPTVEVYDRESIPELEPVLEKWNEVLQGDLQFHLVAHPAADVEVLYDTDLLAQEGYCGLAIVWVKERYFLDRAEVRLSPDPRCGDLYTLLLHEFGHIAGFRGHTADGGVMDSPPGEPVITPQVRNTLGVLYGMMPGSGIPGVSLEPSEIEGIWEGYISTSLDARDEVTFNLARDGTQVTGTFFLGGKTGNVEGKMSGEVWYFDLKSDENGGEAGAHGIGNVIQDTILFTFSGTVHGRDYRNGFGRVDR